MFGAFVYQAFSLVDCQPQEYAAAADGDGLVQYETTHQAHAVRRTAAIRHGRGGTSSGRYGDWAFPSLSCAQAVVMQNRTTGLNWL